MTNVSDEQQQLIEQLCQAWLSAGWALVNEGIEPTDAATMHRALGEVGCELIPARVLNRLQRVLWRYQADEEHSVALTALKDARR
jgi:hypothetical protein